MPKRIDTKKYRIGIQKYRDLVFPYYVTVDEIREGLTDYRVDSACTITLKGAKRWANRRVHKRNKQFKPFSYIIEVPK